MSRKPGDLTTAEGIAVAELLSPHVPCFLASVLVDLHLSYERLDDALMEIRRAGVRLDTRDGLIRVVPDSRRKLKRLLQ